MKNCHECVSYILICAFYSPTRNVSDSSSLLHEKKPNSANDICATIESHLK